MFLRSSQFVTLTSNTPMELSLYPYKPSLLTPSLSSITTSKKGSPHKIRIAFSCNCSSSSSEASVATDAPFFQIEGRRAFMNCFLATAAGFCVTGVADAVSTSRRALKGAKVPESEYTSLPNGLKYYDLKVGNGVEAVKGSRVAPYGFDVGESERGNVLKGLDLGVQGMRVGGQRLLIVPPELAYGSKGVQEIPPNATIEIDIELLSIKQSPFGTPVKIVEG
ncbi:peptidyl-prolyl cis-trans isomerase FKBP16-4, chloroplastic isoform X2 [Lactuca sativa]|uniref:peptidyl-prolyl cis-trans isomerase FKBP16-4, chloroplastic isoform X2 n=1 Tax=Lactuca sativa TaxID=4236 RepID=UPI001C688EF8|nr:peptidyl-prolyl cis-trans isomerase FKBP16-4, chloroplastic isoform X2 [Lactuca sativa]